MNVMNTYPKAKPQVSENERLKGTARRRQKVTFTLDEFLALRVKGIRNLVN